MTTAETDRAAAQARVGALASWHHDWSGLRVAVAGHGPVSFAVADTLVELGARVRVISGGSDAERDRLLEVIGAERFVAADPAAQLADLTAFDPELLIAVPELRLDHPLTTWAEGHGVTVWGDVELAWRLRDKTTRIADWICITGTNGKSTAAQLTAHMLAAGGLRVAPAGDEHTPILDPLRDPQGYDVIVVELSGHQLARLGEISPYASACLNFAEDHIDWHGSVGNAWAAKSRVYANTQVACVYNRADPSTERMVEEADVVEGARAISFGLDSPPPSGFGIVEGILVDRGFHADRVGEAYELVTVEELSEHSLAAPHTAQNVLAAAALARSRGVSPGEIAQAVLSFVPAPHRTQQLGERAGLQWVDDSSATNAHAADAALRTVRDVVWILGGTPTSVSLDSLIAAHVSRLRGAVVIGAEREATLAALRSHLGDRPVVEITAADAADAADAAGQADAADRDTADSDAPARIMAAAVAAAVEIGAPGDTVLFSPAAAPTDQFASAVERGLRFQAAVTELE